MLSQEGNAIKCVASEDKSLWYGKIAFFLLSISLVIGFFFNEDSSGSGGFIADYNNTFGYVEALKQSLFVLPTAWTVHTPLHYIIMAGIHMVIKNPYVVRFIFCASSVAIPYLFYTCLKIKYVNVQKSHLLMLASAIFLCPSFRSGAIWENDHITALFFFLLFLVFFLRWEKASNFEKITGDVCGQLLCLALAVYTRQYYALIYMYCMYLYFTKFSLLNFLKISLMVGVLAIPGFFLIYFDPAILQVTFDAKLQNTVLVNASILSFYLMPIFFSVWLFHDRNILGSKKYQVALMLFSAIVVISLSMVFDYNYKTGGGYFIKLSYLLLGNNILFLMTSMVGCVLLYHLAKEGHHNALLILLLVFGFSAYMIFQKYFEPMFFFIFFLMMHAKVKEVFIRHMNNIYFLCGYLTLYLITGMINDVYRITKTVLWLGSVYMLLLNDWLQFGHFSQ